MRTILTSLEPSSENLELALAYPPPPARVRPDIKAELEAFRDFSQTTRQLTTRCQGSDGKSLAIPTFVNEFWTAKQCQAHSLHEVSYRACFKPQLPRFFIERLTRAGEIVY